MKTHQLSFLILVLTFITQYSIAEETQPTVLQLNPTTIRSRLLENNISLIKSMNQVYDAKDKVNIARGNLLPSIGLSGMIPQGGSFLLSAVNVLVPFLLPSNWSEYYAEKELFEAEKLSYKLMQLNTYSSALSLYYTMINDQEIQAVYKSEYEDLQKIYEIQKLRYDIGLCSEEDLLQSQAQAQLAGLKVSSLQQLNDQEVASIRSALALPLSTTISTDFSNVMASDLEGLDIQTAVDQVNQISPERAQIQYLIKAAKNQTWSKTFSFLNGTALSSVTKNNQDASFSNMNAVGSVNLGFALIPSIQLSDRNVKEIGLQLKSIELQNAQTLESTLKGLVEVKKQLDFATNAEAEMRRVYQSKLLGYDVGTASLLEVITARNQMIESAVGRLKANLSLNLLRITLHRISLAGDFAQVEGCRVASNPNKKSGGFLGGLFGGGQRQEQMSLEQACRNSLTAK